MKNLFLTLCAAPALAMMACGGANAQPSGEAQNAPEDTATVSKVYFIKEITPENLVKIYNALGRKADGKNVAVKISTGESNKSNHLDPALIRPLVELVNGTIIECNTAYGGNRSTTADHLKAAKEHGFTDIAKVDIMDAEGEVKLPVNGGKHLKYDIVGKNYPDYDFTVVLSHFKGHAMGGFGGALKNISIGIASSNGKAYIHTAGKVSDPAKLWENLPEQDDFLESMAEASKAIIDHAGDKILYINVANRLSVDCDCDGDPAAPKMGDIGILASLDPVALDRASVDMVFNSTDPGKADLIERINSRHGTHILDYGEQIGLGSQKYELVTLE
ncbi:MAG: DUF362 domain-containing protein [Muribaculaceae bacterium]